MHLIWMQLLRLFQKFLGTTIKTSDGEKRLQGYMVGVGVFLEICFNLLRHFKDNLKLGYQSAQHSVQLTVGTRRVF
jgi:hypothetical protein